MFEAGAELDLRVSDSAIRAARSTIEDELGDVTVDVDASPSGQLARSGGSRMAGRERAMGRSLLTDLNTKQAATVDHAADNLQLNDERNDLLRELIDTTEQAARDSGGIRGRGRFSNLGSGLGGLVGGLGAVLVGTLTSSVVSGVSSVNWGQRISSALPDLKPTDVVKAATLSTSALLASKATVTAPDLVATKYTVTADGLIDSTLSVTESMLIDGALALDETMMIASAAAVTAGDVIADTVALVPEDLLDIPDGGIDVKALLLSALAGGGSGGPPDSSRRSPSPTDYLQPTTGPSPTEAPASTPGLAERALGGTITALSAARDPVGAVGEVAAGVGAGAAGLAGAASRLAGSGAAAGRSGAAGGAPVGILPALLEQSGLNDIVIGNGERDSRTTRRKGGGRLARIRPPPGLVDSVTDTGGSEESTAPRIDYNPTYQLDTERLRRELEQRTQQDLRELRKRLDQVERAFDRGVR